MPPKIVLASGSRYRQQLLGRLGIDFESCAPDVDETPKPQESPAELAMRLAEAKAVALTKQFPSALIIGSDQTAACGDTLLGKPGTIQRAQEQLRLCRGKQVTFYTGLCLINNDTGTQETSLTPFSVSFLNLSDRQIERYIEKEQPLDCAGSFKCEGLGSALFEKLEGQDPTALIGLPLISLCAMLRRAGLDPLD